jgi:hypothetical protein
MLIYQGFCGVEVQQRHKELAIGSLTRANARSMDGGIWGCRSPSTALHLAKALLSGCRIDATPGKGGKRADENTATSNAPTHVRLAYGRATMHAFHG